MKRTAGWLDHQDVCLKLKISKRTLQTLRDNGTLAYTKIGNRTYTDKKEAGAALIDMCRSAKQPNMAVTIGEFQGFKMSVSFDSFFSKFTISLKGSLSHEVEIGADPLGNLQRLSNALEGMTGKMADVEQKLSNVEHQLETAKVEVTKPFAQEQELARQEAAQQEAAQRIARGTAARQPEPGGKPRPTVSRKSSMASSRRS